MNNIKKGGNERNLSLRSIGKLRRKKKGKKKEVTKTIKLIKELKHG